MLQVAALETLFQRHQYLSSMDVMGISNELKIAPHRIKIWFQNRRARERRVHGQHRWGEQLPQAETTIKQFPLLQQQQQQQMLQQLQQQHLALAEDRQKMNF